MTEPLDASQIPKESEYNYFANNMMYQQYGDFLKWQFDADEYLARMEHNFKGDVWNDDSGTWTNFPDIRIMNDKGVSRVSAFFRSHLGKMFTMSQFDQNRINQIMKEYIHAIQELLLLNREDFQVSPKNFTYIRVSMENAALAGIMGGFEGFRTRQLVSSYRSSEIINKSQEGNKDRQPGLLGFIPRP